MKKIAKAFLIASALMVSANADFISVPKDNNLSENIQKLLLSKKTENKSTKSVSIAYKVPTFFYNTYKPRLEYVWRYNSLSQRSCAYSVWGC